MASEVDISNLALSNLGEKTILSLTDTSAAASACNLKFPYVRDAVLRAYPWSCAIRRASLAKSADAPNWGYSNKFQLPSDPYCLKVLSLKEEDDYDYAWKVEGRFLLTDSDTANIRYVGRLIEVNDWDSLLKEAVAARLSAEVAYRITANRAMAELMQKLYERKLREARTADAQEGTPDSFTGESEWIKARS